MKGGGVSWKDSKNSWNFFGQSNFLTITPSELRLGKKYKQFFLNLLPLIYNAVLVHKTVEIQGNEFRQRKNFTPPEFICPLNWDSFTSSVYLSAPIITLDWGGAYGATESLVMYNGAIYCHENTQV